MNEILDEAQEQAENLNSDGERRWSLYLFAGGTTLLACVIIVIGILQAPVLLGNAEKGDTSMLIMADIGNASLPVGALLGKAEEALSSGDLFVAMELYERVLEMGGSVQVMRRLFDTALLVGDKEKAESVLGLLSFHGAQESTIDALRGLVLLRNGEVEKARAIFEEDPNGPEHAYGLLLVHILMGEHIEAEESLAVLLQSRDPLLVHMARTVKGAYDEFALFEDGKESHLTTLLSRALSQIGQFPIAQLLLQNVVMTDPEYRDAWILFGYSNLMLQNNQEALTAFEKAYAIDPEKAETQYFLGLTHDRLENAAEANMFFGYALQNGFLPQRAVREKLADMASKEGRYVEAVAQYQAILESGDGDAAIAHALVTILINNFDDIEGASKIALSVREEMGDEPEILDIVGWTALLEGDLDEAATFLSSAVQQDPTFAPAWFHKGLLEEQVGSIGDAVNSYYKSYELSLGVDQDLAAMAAERHNGLVGE